jgi:hypothetical protein
LTKGEAANVYSQEIRGSVSGPWREGARQKSLRVHGSHELARKIERKKMSIRDENRHLDVKREVNLRECRR